MNADVSVFRETQLSSEQLATLEEIIKRRWPERWPELVISIGTGMRLSEQYNLTWASVDLVKGVIDLTRIKNGEPRKIPMGREVKLHFYKCRSNAPT